MATTVDEVMGILKDVAERQADLTQAQQETEKALRRMEEAVAQTQKNIDKPNGNFNNKWGHFLENLVKGPLAKLLENMKIKVDRIQPRMIMPETDECGATELDLVALNGGEIVVVEVKTTATKKKVNRFLKKLRAFKKALPEYEKRTVYGAVAYLTEPEGEAKSAAHYAEEQGLYIIVSPGGESSVTAIVNTSSFSPKTF